MGAIEKGRSDTILFNLISMTLAKNKCIIKEINMDTGILDISGKNSISVDTCYDDLQKIFATYLFNN